MSDRRSSPRSALVLDDIEEAQLLVAVLDLAARERLADGRIGSGKRVERLADRAQAAYDRLARKADR